MYQVVIVDDESMIVRLLKKYIDGTGDFQVVAAFSEGTAARDYLIDHYVDLLVTDIRMPGVNGLELAAFVRKNLPACEVVLISGYNEFEYAQKAVSLGVMDYLSKPIQNRAIEQVLSRVRGNIDRRRQSYLSRGGNYEQERLFLAGLAAGTLGEAEFLSGLQGEFSSLAGREGLLIGVASEHAETAALIRSIVEGEWEGTRAFLIGSDGARDYHVLLCSLKSRAGMLERIARRIRELEGHAPVIDLLAEFSSLQTLPGCGALPIRQESIERTEESDSVIEAAQSYIREHLDANLSRGQVAQMVYMNPDYFSRYFKKKTGESYFQFVQRARMEKAIELLKTDMQIQEIRECVGYRNRNFFNDVFREYTGLTPTDYRREVLKKGFDESK